MKNKPEPDDSLTLHLISTLEQIRDYLDILQGDMIRADYFKHDQVPLPASVAGHLDLDQIRPFSYLFIPNVPRDITLVSIGQANQHRLVPIAKGKTLNLCWAGGETVSIDYTAGTGNVDILDVYTSVRPIYLSIY